MRNTILGGILLTSAMVAGGYADTTIYDNQAAFLNDLGANFYLEDFDSFTTGFIQGPLVLGPVNGFSYCISDANRLSSTDPPGSGIGNGLFAGPGMMSTDTDFDEMSIDFEGLNFVGDPCVLFESGSSPVTAVGGNFWLTDFSFNAIGTQAPCPSTSTSCELVISLADSSSTSVTLDEPPPTTFRGFTSDVPISRIVLDSTVLDTWATVDNLYVGSARPDGDFDNDLDWDFADINALTAAIAAMSTDLSFDMNGDGAITLEDVTDDTVGWLAVGGANSVATGGNPFLVGDATLDGVVDGLDFIEWNMNKFTDLDHWCGGDFNADGFVDGLDFIAWNANKFTSSNDGFAVPEPSTALLLISCGLLLLARRTND